MTEPLERPRICPKGHEISGDNRFFYRATKRPTVEAVACLACRKEQRQRSVMRRKYGTNHDATITRINGGYWEIVCPPCGMDGRPKVVRRKNEGKARWIWSFHKNHMYEQWVEGHPDD